MAELNGATDDGSCCIVFGLLNGQGKYLTAEKFGNQISVTGASLRQKQMWTFVQDEEGGSKVQYSLFYMGLPASVAHSTYRKINRLFLNL